MLVADSDRDYLGRLSAAHSTQPARKSAAKPARAAKPRARREPTEEQILDQMLSKLGQKLDALQAKISDLHERITRGA